MMSGMFARTSSILAASLFFACLLSAQTLPAASTNVKYGSNPAAGSTFTHVGVRLYYETYGEGEPLYL